MKSQRMHFIVHVKSFELIVSFYMRRINSFYQSVCRTNRKADEEPT